MESALASLESSGGYAILLGLVVIGLFVLAQRWVDSLTRGAVAREERAQVMHREDIERERHNADAYRETTERMTNVVQGNTAAITTLVETIRPMQETLSRIDRHLLHGSSQETKREN